MNKVKYFQKGSQMWAKQEGLLPEEPKLVPTLQTQVTAQEPSETQKNMDAAKATFDQAVSNYDNVPKTQYNLAGMSRRDLKTLAEVGGGVKGMDGKLQTIAPGSNWRDIRKMQKDAERMQSLQQFQVGNPNVPGTTTKTATTPTTTQTASNKTYNWDINFDKDGDFSWDNISTKLLQAMYANGKYDILDKMLDNGKITDNGLAAFYKTTLGLTPGENGKIRFNKDALQAALNGQYITQAQFDELSGLLPQSTTTPTTTPTTPTTTQRSEAFWLAQAKKYGFNNLDEVKKWQMENGLEADGKFWTKSKAVWDALQHVQNTPIAQQQKTPAEETPWYSEIQKYYNSKKRGLGGLAGRNDERNYGTRITKKGGLSFDGRRLVFYNNGRVWDDENKRMGNYAVNPDHSINFEHIGWDKNGGKIMKYFQAGGAINQQQVAQEQGDAQREAMIELLQGLAAGKPQEAIANFANRMGIDEATADYYTQKILKDWADSINQAKTDPETKALVGSAITNYQNYKQKYNRPAGAPAPMAKQGTKLEYIQRLRGICPEGYELKMFKAGGKVCKKCQKIEEACKGKKMEDGGESPIVQQFKNGRKCKK